MECKEAMYLFTCPYCEVSKTHKVIVSIITGSTHSTEVQLEVVLRQLVRQNKARIRLTGEVEGSMQTNWRCL